MAETILPSHGRSGSTAPSLQASSEASGEEEVEVEKPPRQTRQSRDKEQPHRLAGKCNNREGKNQYKDRPPRDDPHVANILRGYHAKGITDNRIISKMLLEEHKITLSEGSVHRRRKLHGLHASRTTMKQLDEETKRELILEQLRKDPTGKVGPRVIKIRIFQDRGIHLTRCLICSFFFHYSSLRS
ncbi:hypothetical protein CPC08DRAFT_643686 [Agrocybe pediades]|nr:hypothetical protein CPC08DRAFT_643686 [Agrocybe pediades]